MEYSEIVKQLERYVRSLTEEGRLVQAGLRTSPNYGDIHKEYSDLFSRETTGTVRNLMTDITDKQERDRMERVLFALVEGAVESNVIGQQEELVRDRLRMTAEIGNEKIGYTELRKRISREPDFEKRQKLQDERARLTDKLNPKRLEIERLFRRNLATYGFASIRDYAETKKRIRYETFLQKTLPILEETTGLYRRVLSEVLKQSFGRSLGDASPAHATYLFSGHAFDYLFRTDQLGKLCHSAFEKMGLALDKGGIIIDLENRNGKSARAACIAVDAPNKVHIVLSPQGGYADYHSLMHEGGHALHLANMNPSLPFEFRMLPRSNALPELFAFTMGRLIENPIWLEHVLRIPKDAAEDISSWALLRNLSMLRRYLAKFTYELTFDASPFDTTTNRKTYASTLKDLTGFAYEEAFYLEDIDPMFYSADYLRAWIASAQLEEHLVRTYGDRWFLKQETGRFFTDLFSKGFSWESEDVISSLGMTPWDPLPLIRTFDGVKKLLR